MITSDVLADLAARTATLRTGFAGTAPRDWDPATAAAELAVQLGHLALCVARRTARDVTGFDDPGRPIQDLSDELADVVLTALSVAVLADAVPDRSGAAPVTASEPIGALLVLQVCAGQLAEAAMVAAEFRHAPTGSPPPIAAACARTLAAADQLCEVAGVDLHEAFIAMDTNATAFLKDFARPRREQEQG